MTEQQVMKYDRETIFDDALPNYYKFISWARWYPDLFLDLLKPQTGGINLALDQRVYLRSDVRFFGVYGTFSRGFSKTFLGVLSAWVTAILYPGISIALTAQTKENAAGLLKNKSLEILKFYPLLQNELKREPKFSKDEALIEFKNDSVIDNLANAQSSKGQRRTRIKVEESVLLNNELFEDALEPIVEVPRYTVGEMAIPDPCELNQQINFYSTSGYRGSDEYQRSCDMYDNMCELKGNMVLGANWMLPCYYGRGSNKSKILQKKRTASPIAFAQNYEEEWVGSSDGSLVNINKLMDCRTLTTPLVNFNRQYEEFYLGVDVARSQSKSNNQSAIVIARAVRHNMSKRIVKIEIPNIISVSNATNFTAQACQIKKTAKEYHATATVVDGNGLGAGLIDELLKCAYDPVTNEYLGCWDTINTSNIPEVKDAEKCLFDLKAQKVQGKVITDFIGVVESKKLRLLEKKQETAFSQKDQDNFDQMVMPYVQTDFLFEEIANLKIRYTTTGQMSVQRVVRKMDKDRWSALAYVIYYIMEYCDLAKAKATADTKHILSMARKPHIFRD